MECSVCHSTNLVKVSLAYEQGLSDYHGQSRSRGMFAGTAGLGLWGGGTTSRRPPEVALSNSSSTLAGPQAAIDHRPR